MWYVYILQCCDKSLYTGITNDLSRRLEEHNTGQAGAKYTSGRRPVKLMYAIRKKDKRAAAREECRIKKLSRREKLKLVPRQSGCFQDYRKTK
jgi:putative endonuclease